MMATVSPASDPHLHGMKLLNAIVPLNTAAAEDNYDETVSTLRFASSVGA